VYGFQRNYSRLFFHMAGSNILSEDAWIPT
jgi:hypothetical protein